MNKKLLFLFTLSALLLSGCGNKKSKTSMEEIYAPNQEVIAYGLTHGHYLGFSIIRTDQNGKISDVVIDEIFLPYSWANMGDFPSVANQRIINHPWREGTEMAFAEYIMVAGKYFELNEKPSLYIDNAFDEDYREVDVNGNPSGGGISSLMEWIFESETNMARYYDSMIKKNADILMMRGGELVSDPNSPFTTLSDYEIVGHIVKGEGSYWAKFPNDTGFKNNVRNLQNYLLLYGFNFDVATDTKREESRIYISDVVTGATMADYKDYLAVAQAAYTKLQK